MIPTYPFVRYKDDVCVEREILPSYELTSLFQVLMGFDA